MDIVLGLSDAVPVDLPRRQPPEMRKGFAAQKIRQSTSWASRETQRAHRW